MGLKPWTLADPTDVEDAVAELRVKIIAAARDPRVVNFARGLVAFAPSGDDLAVARTIRSWLASHWRFAQDPVDLDYNRPVVHSLDQYESQGLIVGDCDDAAMVAGALVRSLGFPVDLVVLSFAPDPRTWQHVYAEVLTAGGTPVDFDVTKPRSGPVPPTAYEAHFPV